MTNPLIKKKSHNVNLHPSRRPAMLIHLNHDANHLPNEKKYHPLRHVSIILKKHEVPQKFHSKPLPVHAAWLAREGGDERIPLVKYLLPMLMK